MAVRCMKEGRNVTYLYCQECGDRSCRQDNCGEYFVLLIAGTRKYNDYQFFSAAVDWQLKEQVKKGRQIMIVEGGAEGADKMAARYAEEKGYLHKCFPADWDAYGPRAGYIRNEKMHAYIAGFPNRGVLLFWDGVSRGTGHSLPLAERFNTPCHIYKITI